MSWRGLSLAILVVLAGGHGCASAEDEFAKWPILTSTFSSTGGGGIIIKGYDPVITGEKCMTTFMAVPEGKDPPVYPNLVEYEAVGAQGGILCHNAKWRSFDGNASGTSPFRLFFKDGVFRGHPLPAAQ